jgi:hypothetical protein
VQPISQEWVFSDSKQTPSYFYFLPSLRIRENLDLISSGLVKNLTLARIAPNRNESYMAPLINDRWSKPNNKSLISNIVFLGEVDAKIPGILIEPTVVTTPSSIEIKNLQLNSSAYVYAFIERISNKLTRNSNDPVPQPPILPNFKQMRTGSNLSSYPVVHYRKFEVYVPGRNFSIRFDNLDTFTIYRLYYQVASEDPINPVGGDFRSLVVETKFQGAERTVFYLASLILALVLCALY